MPEVSLPNTVDHANVRVVPPLIYVVILGAAWLLQKLVPLPALPLALSRIGGGTLIVAGLGLCWWSVGLFWRAPSPDSPPFVEVGSRVGAEDTIGIVEVMKLMTPVAAGRAGIVSAVLVDNGAMVEHGQSLVLIAE